MNTLFETERLIVREYEPTDFEQIHAYSKEKEVVQYQDWGPNKKEDTLAFLNDSISQKNKARRLTYELCIELKGAGIVIGGCGMFLENNDLKKATIGYIINPRYWGKGYATEATIGLLKYGKTQLGVETIRATTDNRNKASHRVLEKIGFRLERIIENDFEQKGRMRDTCLFKLEE